MYRRQFPGTASRAVRYSCIPIVIAILSIPSFAQSGSRSDVGGTGGANTLQGRVYFPSGLVPQGAYVKVKLESTDMANLSTLTDANGAFKFSGLLAGNYTLIVDAGKEYELVREPFTLDRETTRGRGMSRIVTMPVYLRPRASSSVPQPGVVDARLAAAPQPAQDAYNKGVEASKAGDLQQAVEHLKQAIELHPEFPLALNELGVQYLRLGQPGNAVEPLRSAVKLTPDAFMPRLNFGIALLENKEIPKAESELRLAVKANEASPVAHLYLGIALVKQKQLDEGAVELERAVASGREDMAMAHYYLGGIYWGRREYKRAADSLETYLKLAPEASDAERLRSTIKELRSKQQK